MPRQQLDTSETLTDGGADRDVYRLDIAIPRDSDVFRSINNARKRADGIPDLSFPRQVLEILHEWHNARVGNHPAAWEPHGAPEETSGPVVPDEPSDDATNFSVDLDPTANPNFVSQWTRE